MYFPVYKLPRAPIDRDTIIWDRNGKCVHICEEPSLPHKCQCAHTQSIHTYVNSVHASVDLVNERSRRHHHSRYFFALSSLVRHHPLHPSHGTLIRAATVAAEIEMEIVRVNGGDAFHPLNKPTPGGGDQEEL